VRYGVLIVVAAALLGGSAGTAGAAGTFKGTFGDVIFKSRKRAVACHYNRAFAAFLVTGAQVKQRGRLQRGASAGAVGPDPSAPGTVFPLVLSEATASFIDGSSLSPAVWTGSFALGNGIVVTITAYKRGKVSGTLVGTLDPSLGGATGLIQVNATFNAKCTIQ
jgi:hypothetical protein